MPEPPASTSRRLLLINYHFGENGATGGFRWAAMVREFVGEGWEVDVITASRESVDTAGVTLHHVPEVTRAHRAARAVVERPLRAARRLLRSPVAPVEASRRTPALEDEGHLRRRIEALPLWKAGDRLPPRLLLVKTYSMLLVYADALAWAHRAARVGTALVRSRRHHLVVVSSPPHASQWAGYRIARLTGIPYVADYRDPWSVGVPELDGYASPAAQRFGAWLEARTQSAARVVVHNTQVALERAIAQSRLPRVPRVSIPNGYEGEPSPAAPSTEEFRILFAGWIYETMDLRVLLRAVETLRREDPGGTSALRLEFIGSPAMLYDVPLTELVRAYGLRDCTRIRPRVSRDEAMRAQEDAAVLVAFDYQQPLAVVMKFYDYLRARGQLLLFAERGSALDRTARSVGQRTVSPSDHEGAVRELRRALERWRARDYPRTHDPERVLHRRARSMEMLALADGIVGSSARSLTSSALASVTGG